MTRSRRVARARSPRQPLAPAVALSLAGLVVGGLFLWLLYPFIVPAGAPWEHAWLLALHGAAGRRGVDLAGDVSVVGYPLPIAIVTAACLAGWLLAGSAWKAGFLLVDTAVLAILDYGAKPLFHRNRPALFPHAFVAGFAYPSGHALFSAGYYGMIAYLLACDAPRGLRRWVWALWILLALAVGLSRLVLGVHWPTDVLAGYGCGLLVLAWTTSAARRWRRGGRRGGRLPSY